MSGYRRAALALHALAPADQRWLLAQLADPQRERLLPLLGELKTLGARFDSADIEALAADNAVPVLRPVDAAPRGVDPVRDPLAEVDTERLSQALAGEPDWMVSALGRMASPAVRERLAEALGPSRAGWLGSAPAGSLGAASAGWLGSAPAGSLGSASAGAPGGARVGALAAGVVDGGAFGKASTPAPALGPAVQRALMAALLRRADSAPSAVDRGPQPWTM